MEIATAGRTPVGGQHQWLEVLRRLDLDGLRIRPGRPGEQPKIDNRGTAARPSYRLIGILTASDKLRLPGGTFSRNDLGRLKEYLENLRNDGAEGVTEKKEKYGLTARQLIPLTRDLETPVGFSTADLRPSEIVRRIGPLLKTPLVIDPAANTTLGRAEPFADSLQGISSGTALAAALRPWGLVLAPGKPAGGKVQLRVTPAGPQTEAWPVGWPPERSSAQVLPALFKFAKVEVEDIPLAQVLPEIGKRLQVPLLIDRAALTRHRIDLTQTKVSIPPGRTYYKRVLDRILVPSKLKYQLRTDEAGKPFVWVTTQKP